MIDFVGTPEEFAELWKDSCIIMIETTELDWYPNSIHTFVRCCNDNSFGDGFSWDTVCNKRRVTHIVADFGYYVAEFKRVGCKVAFSCDVIDGQFMEELLSGYKMGSRAYEAAYE